MSVGEAAVATGPQPVAETAAAAAADRATLHGLVEAQAARRPERTAIHCGDAGLAYGELDRRANRLARHLAARDIGAGSTVGILLHRTLQLPVALLGVLKTGAAYLPLDPHHPSRRLGFTLDDAGADLLLTESELVDAIPGCTTPRLALDEEERTIAERSAAPLPESAGADDLAYLIYTSGSTGKPKGVEIPHRGVVNVLGAMSRRPGLDADDVLLAVTTVSFDISILEIFLPLIVGGRLELADSTVAHDGALLAQRLASGRITVLQATPASWRMLLEAGWEGTPGLRALCGGEALPPHLAERLLPGVGELWNVYGPTETTIWSTAGRVETAEPPIAIGLPVEGTRLWIVDEELRPVPPGESGELLIGGVGLARGYRNRPELTAERFVTLPGSAERVYRTGDLARLLPDGRLECLGRLDHQVKVRGFRIEPGEIEGALESHPAVRSAVVVARQDSTGENRLAAYYTSDDERADGELAGALRAHIEPALPHYMVPSAFVRLAELPLTGSGKVDRKALPDPSAAASRRADGGRPPESELERTIAAIWEEALEVQDLGVGEDFFELGGHSLLMHRIRARLTGELGRELSMVELFRHPTVAGLASWLEGGGEEADGDDGVYGRGNPHSLMLLVRRFLVPGFAVSLYYYLKCRAKISPRAEVELSARLVFGRGCTVGSFTKIKADKGPLVIGERSSFANSCFIGSGTAGLRIGRNLVCGPNVNIVPSNYVFDRKRVHLEDQGHTSKGIRIGDNVWIGAGSTLLDGAELGDDCIVAAGSVVDRRFPAGSVLRGNPAEIVAER